MRALPRRVTLRVTLLVLLTGLLLLTVGAIGLVALRTTSAAVEELADTHFRAISGAAALQVRGLVEPATLILQEFRTQTYRGLLPIGDPEAMGERLVERLRYERGMAWLSYSDHATGRFVGAWRDVDGSVVLNRSAPNVDGGRPYEEIVTTDGEHVPLRRTLPGGYDPRERAWYQLALSEDDVVWTEPFRFNEGKLGITAALALRDRETGAPLGVFTADFFLEDVAQFLSALTIGRTGRAYVLSPTGVLIAGPSVRAGEAVDPVLSGAIGALPLRLSSVGLADTYSVVFDHDGVRYAAVFQQFNLAGGLRWITAVVVPEAEFLGIIYENTRATVAIGSLALLVAIGLGYLLAHSIASPLRRIADDLEQVGQFKFSLESSPSSFVKEIAVVSDSVDRMKAGLRSFGRYVPVELVRDMLASGTEAKLGGETRLITVQFSDIGGFTHISETMSPPQLVQYLAEYLEAMSASIRDNAGTIDKFMGDGILALFNAPQEVPDHAARACHASLEAIDRLERLRGRWEHERKPIFGIRIGLNTGEVLVGNIGTSERFAYTVIGDAVNLASRLEALNKVYGTSILASQAVYEAAGPGFEWRRLDRVAVVGRSEGTLVYELLGHQGAVAPSVLEARDSYEEGLLAYFGRRFEEAQAAFAAAADLPGNRAAEIMAHRAQALVHVPPPETWDGVYLQTSK
jgi:adenylate cyclase